ncbi:hypothetical protein O2V63_03315 [Modestobacter sp. VKM Ac-2977]|uniref:hypothetical protein n=1 Tax=Modestobacter sp. VKM Ac-2977 TaxID=3004131 RepID=UPI0022AA29CE|nr:hypothetical protein [Modestobacter sp. VKM Ac-2977]MCZ2819355.1 hypothetical protein [Modestobacter sp. VKM Ac-2977]
MIILGAIGKGVAGLLKHGIAPALIAVGGAVVGGVLAPLWTGSSVDRPAAEEFINSYYREVTNPETVERAWSARLTVEQQDRQPITGFADWWSDWSGVVVNEVEQPPGTRNTYVAHVAYVDKNGKQHSYRPIVFVVTCTSPLVGRVPGLSCDSGDVRLSDSWRVVD